MSEHYTATIKITKTDRVTESYPRNAEKAKNEGTREVQEVASLVIRADSIDELTAKATAHLQLVED